MLKKNSKGFKDGDLKGVSGGNKITGFFGDVGRKFGKLFKKKPKTNDGLQGDVNKVDGSLGIPDDKD